MPDIPDDKLHGTIGMPKPGRLNRPDRDRDRDRDREKPATSQGLPPEPMSTQGLPDGMALPRRDADRGRPAVSNLTPPGGSSAEVGALGGWDDWVVEDDPIPPPPGGFARAEDRPVAANPWDVEPTIPPISIPPQVPPPPDRPRPMEAPRGRAEPRPPVHQASPPRPPRPEADIYKTVVQPAGRGESEGPLPEDARAVGIFAMLPGQGQAQWRRLGIIQVVNERPVTIGRYFDERHDRELPTLAPSHFRVWFDDDQATIEPDDTINGIFLKLRQHEEYELDEGARILVGRYLMEFRSPDPSPAPRPKVGLSGEEFRARVLRPRGVLDVLGPDEEVCCSIPLTKPDATTIGRTGEKCDIALPDDELVSRVHAQVVFRDGRAYLRDSGSTNGTFLRIDGPRPLLTGTQRAPQEADEILAGELIFRFLDL